MRLFGDIPLQMKQTVNPVHLLKNYSTKQIVDRLLGCPVQVQNFGCIFFRKSKSGFRNPKTDFPVFLGGGRGGGVGGKYKNGSWLHKIHSRGGFSDQIQIRIFDCWFTIWAFFWERIWKKVFLTNRFSKKTLNLCWWPLINFERLVTFIRRRFLNPYLSRFLYGCSVCLRRFIFQ